MSDYALVINFCIIIIIIIIINMYLSMLFLVRAIEGQLCLASAQGR